ncbi:MAG: hypothetical protein DRI57_06625 [Deltaproteobacteria bacterium]|nr:MAG: hypothetical protein DRI57_06625 [Deltaproteobacteria bacterium]
MQPKDGQTAAFFPHKENGACTTARNLTGPACERPPRFSKPRRSYVLSKISALGCLNHRALSDIGRKDF